MVVDGRLARNVVATLGAGFVESWEPSGAVRLRILVPDQSAFVDWAIGLGDTAEILTPPEVRAAVVRRLGDLADSPEQPTRPSRSARSLPVAPVSASLPATDAGEDRAEANKRPLPAPQATAGDRLNRLLAILVYLARVGEARLADLAARFSVSQAELIHDLELAACCGVPPYTPDQLIDLLIDEDRVVAEGLRELAHPVASRRKKVSPSPWPHGRCSLCRARTTRGTWPARSSSSRRCSGRPASPSRSIRHPRSALSRRRSPREARSRSTTSAPLPPSRRRASSTPTKSSSGKGSGTSTGGATGRTACGASRSIASRPCGRPDVPPRTSIRSRRQNESRCQRPEAFLGASEAVMATVVLPSASALCRRGACHSEPRGVWGRPAGRDHPGKRRRWMVRSPAAAPRTRCGGDRTAGACRRGGKGCPAGPCSLWPVAGSRTGRSCGWPSA